MPRTWRYWAALALLCVGAALLGIGFAAGALPLVAAASMAVGGAWIAVMWAMADAR